MRTLITNTAQLLTMAGPDEPRRGAGMSSLGLILDGAVLVEDGVITAVGSRDRILKQKEAASAEVVDAHGRVVMPGFVDSHAHPVFAAPRLDDFEARIGGKSYEEIAAAGGGIALTVSRVRGASEERLATDLAERAERFLSCGTTTLEAKSGYGLDSVSEFKMLRAISKASKTTPLEIIPTFLGAHTLPVEMQGRRAEYVRQICEEMIPAVVKGNLARFTDVFCDKDFFSVEESRQIFAAAAKNGLKVKIHAEQLSRTGAARLACECGALSADHLDCVDEADMEPLSVGRTVAALVPGSNYFLSKPYPPARRLIERGAAVALATDFNPGTCPCWDMRFILSIACTQMRMSPAEVLIAATINGACALGLEKTQGSLEPGKKADIVCWEAQDYRELPYYFGAQPPSWVMKAGNMLSQSTLPSPLGRGVG